MIRARFFLVIVFLLIFWPWVVNKSQADDARPAYLEIREIDPERCAVMWKTPMLQGARLRLAPRFPDDFRIVSGSYDRRVLGDALIESWQFEMDGGLAGCEIGIEGLALTLRDVVLRLYFADGQSTSALLNVSRPTYVIPEIGGEVGYSLATRLQDALIRGVQHGLLVPVHLLFALALGLAGGGRMLGTSLAVFLLLHLVGILFGEGGLFVPSTLGEAALGIAAALMAREAMAGRARRLCYLAGVSGFVHGLALGTTEPGPIGDLIAFTLGLDVVQLFICVMALGIIRLLPRRSPLAYLIGAAGISLALLAAVRSSAPTLMTPSLAGLPAALSDTQIRPPTSGVPSPPVVRGLTAPVQAYLDVGLFETRLEILARLELIERWLDLQVGGRDTVSVGEQETMLGRVTQKLSERLEVRIDGRVKEAATVRRGFATVDASGTYLRAEPVPELISSAIVGVVQAFATRSVPNEVVVMWRELPPGVSEILARTIDPESTRDIPVSAESPQLAWRNELRNDPLPAVEAVTVHPARLRVPVLTSVLALMALVLFGLALQRRRMVHSSVTVRLVLAAACAVAPVWIVTLPVNLPAAAVPDQREATAIMGALLTNIYRAFDYREEESVYDRLAVSVAGDLLSQVYLDQRYGLEVEKAGGAHAKVEAVEVTAVQDLTTAPEGGFAAVVEWTVAGSVTHFGHRHIRQNRYRAALIIGPVAGEWKILTLDVRDEERIK